ncbi:MAG: hypothetical protein JWM57_2111 [Phycisphaerales bacterium]|nr:hypothetical protein [Phycisphaerales bacterium]
MRMESKMASSPVSPLLETYLDDHLAGAVAGVALLDDLLQMNRGSELAEVIDGLRLKVSDDRKVLEQLIANLGFRQSRVRSTSAWLAEKLTRLKARIDDRAGGTFQLMEMIEAMSLGVEGKRMLWVALSAVAEISPTLNAVDYGRLIKRAQDQRQVLETLRLSLATKAFADGPAVAKDTP